MSAQAKTIRCRFCSRLFATQNAEQSHARSKHRRLLLDDDREPSFAERAIDAEIDRAMGRPNFDATWLLP